MKLSKMMIAVAMLATGSAAFAQINPAEVVRMSGASALKANIGFAINSLCVQAGGVLQEWISGGNISTYVCTAAGGLTSGAGGTYAAAPANSFVKLSGTDFSEVRLNVAGGSYTSLQVAAGGNDNYLNPALGGTVAVGGAVNAGVTGGQVASEPGIGGFNDVEYTGFASSVLATIPDIDNVVGTLTVNPVGAAQAFGVAASDAMYTAMFDAQKASGFIPATCVVTDTAIPACVPSIGKGQMASIMSNSTTSAGKTLGARFLAPQLGAGLELRYVRRVDTSGTQASAANYFLGIGNMSTPLAIFADPSRRTQAGATVAPAGTCNAGDLRGPAFTDNEADTAFVANGQINLCDRKQGNLRTLAAPGTGDVRNELNKATILGGGVNYAIGVMSAENDQATYRNTANVNVPTTWKWLRVQGAPVGENAKPGTAGNTNRNTLISGDYDFYYESWTYTKPSAENDALISALIGEMAGGPALKGLATVGTSANQTPYNRGGRTDTPSAR